ncbi:UNVERIFIED_CONTAM: hypothetical protein PYX00_010879 [Menopon gallinae]|uniref:Uncharacterized protein n=1 Tax=Menopon gallinae TaxID=328185 RepID=A0AAW2H6I1_9NEOP
MGANAARKHRELFYVCEALLRPLSPLITNLRVDLHTLHLDTSPRPDTLLSIDVSDVTRGTCRVQHFLQIDLFMSTESLIWCFFASRTRCLTTELDIAGYFSKQKDSAYRVEDARSLLIDFDVELVDSDKTINYFLLCQRAMEILNQTEDDESVLHFISEKIYPITDDELRESLKDLLEYLVFKTGDSIEVRRRKLASFINAKILNKYNCRPNKLKDIVKGILEGESKLQTKYKFPVFRSYL